MIRYFLILKCKTSDGVRESNSHVICFLIFNLEIFLSVFWCLLAAEDPSENYVKLRDFVLVKLCQNLPSFAEDKLLLGFSADMVQEAQDKLKINKVLCKTCNFQNSVSLLIKCQWYWETQNTVFSFFGIFVDITDLLWCFWIYVMLYVSIEAAAAGLHL